MPRQYSLENTRNIGIMAHIDAGKTATTERILYYTDVSHKIGETHNGAFTMDWMAQEQECGITITSAAITATWRGTCIDIIDTPSHVDFTVEVERSLCVLDGAVTILDAKAGVESQTETIWRQATTYDVPRIVFCNKMDVTGTDFLMSYKAIVDRLGAKPYPIQLPVGAESTFTDIVDIIKRKSEIYTNDLGVDIQGGDVPEDLKDLCKEYRSELIDCLADYDEGFMIQVLEGEEPSIEDIKRALRIAVCTGDFFPILCGSACKNKGIQMALDAVVEYLPSPLDVPVIRGALEGGGESERHSSDEEPFAALVFEITTDPFVGKLSLFRVCSGIAKAGSYVLDSTKGERERFGRIVQIHANARKEVDQVYAGDIAAAVSLKVTTTGDNLCAKDSPIILESTEFPEPVIELPLEPKIKTDQDKTGLALTKLAEEDPTFKTYTGQEIGQTIITGVGELRLDIVVNRLRHELKAKANVGQPMAVYRETTRGTVEYEGKYIKQSGGREQYGHVWIKFEPQEEGKGFEFADATVGGNVPRKCIKLTEEGLRDAPASGIIASYQVVDIKATLSDGSYHDIDSSEMTYKIAASIALKAAAKRRNLVILEPIMMVEVITPNEYLGPVVGDVSSRRGAIVDQEERGNVVIIKVHTPLSEIFGYVTDLRSFTQGRGNYSMKFNHYAKVPESIAEKIIKNNSSKN